MTQSVSSLCERVETLATMVVNRRKTEDGQRFIYEFACELAAHVEELERERDELRARSAERSDVCWHCGDVLSPEPRERPRCYQCPIECDDANCDAMGCRDEKGAP